MTPFPRLCHNTLSGSPPLWRKVRKEFTDDVTPRSLRGQNTMAEDLFKKEFKRFKRPSVADMKEVIDPSNSDRFPQLIMQPCCEEAVLHKRGCSTGAAEELGLLPPHLWQVFGVESISGSVNTCNVSMLTPMVCFCS